jgi:hypothetical protein
MARLGAITLVAIAVLSYSVSVAAQTKQRPTMTGHVPEAVSSGLAPLVGHVPSTQHLSLAVSLPLRNRAELDDLCANGVCREQGGGTSYAAPLWAGLTAMMNQQALANGGSTVGFLNPALYAIGTGSIYGSDFHDITTGSNGQYSAVTGYDLVTGWGSPNGPNLINTLVGSAAAE